MTDRNKTNRPKNNGHKDSTAINPKIQQRMQQLLTDLQLDDAPAGGSLVIYQAGKCIAQASVGMAQAELPWRLDTLSLNFSTGKGVLATLVHVLVSQQLLDYDLPIAKYWPIFAANGKADITLRAVMSHQANLFAITTIDADSETLLDWDEMVAKVAGMPRTQPDNAGEYNSDSYASGSYTSAYSALVYGWILGGLIEAVTNMSLAAALRHYLTEPLGIADSCYFGVPADKVDDVAKLVKNFHAKKQDSPQHRSKRHKPVLKAESAQTLSTYAKLTSYNCWQQQAMSRKIAPVEAKLNTTQINRLYFDHNQLNLKNYKAALIPNGQQAIDYYRPQTLQAVLPAANGVASAQALATVYAMLANGGKWQGRTLIDSATFSQLSAPQVTGMDAVMPSNMDWRLGYHRLFHLCQDERQVQGINTSEPEGFGHMGYNGSVAWCDPARQLSFAFVHNFDVTMLNDIRQFALTEALLKVIDTETLD
ncbi:serine hydrolase domain-containing protein [Psychrobacter sp. LV10R520-6]|uniref:serine hydrolase domain-containing protein n=1 Tax=Psychrobacter sp. LV10R520-6 TaxID=1415574 RepID=UPI0024CA1995|nr:serine hydrolase domain-containing protein [Psychrobacter sp. LV10R520-6]SNT69533.1 Beta-lactamase [Psychrobacter sp. LV10R520-6]